MSDVAIKDANTEATIEMPSIGLGTLRTSATYAALFIALEGCRESRMDVLSSVMEALGIFPEELIHLRKMPDVTYARAHSEWKKEAERIHAQCLSANKS